jgi:hypothetical protein
MILYNEYVRNCKRMVRPISGYYSEFLLEKLRKIAKTPETG